MTKKLTSAKNFVARHKATIVVGAIAVSAIALQQRNQREFNAFLEEKNLLEEYYTPENTY